MVTLDQLSQRYRRGQRYNLARLYLATVISFLIPILILIGRPVFMLYQAMRPGLQNPEPFESIYLHVNMLSGLLLIGVAAYWFLQWMKFGEGSIADAEPLDLSFLPGCDSFLAEAKHKLHVSLPIKITATATGLATATAVKRQPVIGISPFFGMLYEEEPDTARFALAHELSHISQGDTRMLARLDWLALFTRQLLYWYFIVEAIFIIVYNIGMGMVLNATQGESGAKLYKDQLFYAFLQAVLLIVLFNLARGGLLIVRKLRHTSEFLADLGSATVANPAGFARWLVQQTPQQNAALRSTHPSNDVRISKLREYASAWGTDLSVVQVPAAPQQDVLHQKLKAGPMLRMLGGALLIYGYLGRAVMTIGGSSQFNMAAGLMGGVAALLAVGKFAIAYRDDGPQLPHRSRIKAFSVRSLLLISGVTSLLSLPIAWSSWNYLHRSTPTPVGFDTLHSGQLHDGDWIRIKGVEIDDQTSNPKMLRLIDTNNPLYSRWKALNGQIQTLPQLQHSTSSELTPDEWKVVQKYITPAEQARLSKIGQDYSHFMETSVGDQIIQVDGLLQLQSGESNPDFPTYQIPDLNYHELEDEVFLRQKGLDDAAIKAVHASLKMLQSLAGEKSRFANLMHPDVTWTGNYMRFPDAQRSSSTQDGKQLPIGVLIPAASPYPSPPPVFLCDIFLAAVIVFAGCLIQYRTRSHVPNA